METILELFAGEVVFVVASLVFVAPVLVVWGLIYLVRAMFSARPVLWLLPLLISAQAALCAVTFVEIVPFPRLLWLEVYGVALSALALAAIVQIWRHPRMAAGKRLNAAVAAAAVWLLPPLAAVVMLLLGGV